MNKGSYHSMKRGLALSLALHVVFVSWGAITFIHPVSLPQQLEAIPITLAPLTQELSSQQGSVNAPLRAIPAVKPTTKPQEKEDARHVGEGQIDSSAPFKPKEKPRTVETTPSPSGEEKAPEKTLPELTKPELSETETPLERSEDTPKVMPEVPLERQEDTPKVMPEVPLEKQEDTPKVMPEVPLERSEDTPKVMPEVPLERQEDTPKVMPEVPLEVRKNEERVSPQELTPVVKKEPVKQATIQPQLPQIALPEKPLLPQLKPKPAKEVKIENVQAHNQKKQPIKDKTIEDILAMEENNLLNRARTQGGGAKRSDTPEALGARKNINDTTKMAQTLVSIVGGCIQQKLKLVALGGDLKNRPVVRLRFTLNREGMVMGDPIIDPLSGAQSQQDIMIRQVYAAVFACQPYADLPRDQYDLWGQGFDFNVDPLQEIIR
ncbi:cell envelope biogenesis protein TolA [Bartonella sp. ML70XJBT.G]|uniref:cell envelope biogenesis protein TolA n=1 Tax=Bartonella sp. ML70XJBT.G TaxID=3019093 RepID=UPI0023624BE3|nr:cell envelope biogenesis protein TolA [Bartonella sp. ML70XJBT.G]